MVRAIFFDFYGVWTPDVFNEYLNLAAQQSPELAGELSEIVDKYFRGQVDAEFVAGSFRYKLARGDIDTALFTLPPGGVAMAIVEFMRNLHGHFVKLGVLANLGIQEYQLLKEFNQQNQLLEVIGGPLPFESTEPLLSQVIFAEAMQRIGEPPESCVVISGSPAYLQFAQGLGMTSLPFEGFPKLQQVLNSLLVQDTIA